MKLVRKAVLLPNSRRMLMVHTAIHLVGTVCSCAYAFWASLVSCSSCRKLS